jgi:hypothetical protein
MGLWRIHKWEFKVQSTYNVHKPKKKVINTNWIKIVHKQTMGEPNSQAHHLISYIIY